LAEIGLVPEGRRKGMKKFATRKREIEKSLIEKGMSKTKAKRYAQRIAKKQGKEARK